MNRNQHFSYQATFGEVDLVPGTLRGYRGWRWDGRTMALMSTAWMHLWRKERQQPDADCLVTRRYRIFPVPHCTCTVCKIGTHASPGRRCTCGYYASYDPMAYVNQGPIYIDGFNVHGTISAHGLIVLGTGGFRAQRVQVDAFWGQNDNAYLAARQYEVPLFPTQQKMLQEFPPSNVEELLQTRTP